MKHNASIIFRSACLGLLGTFLLITVATGAAPKKGLLKITRVALDRKVFNPSEGQKVTLSFEITRQADVQVVLYDRLGQKVRGFDMPDIQAGRHSVTWDGYKADDKLPAGDVFLYVIEAKTKDGKKATYNQAKETGGIEVKTLEYTLDKETGEVEYVLPKTCMIRLRAGLKDGMFAKTILDWKPSTAGRHAFTWDGMDSSGRMYLLKRRDLDLRLTCYTLPANTIITTGAVTAFESANNPSETKLEDRDRLWATKGKYFHYKHDPRICHQPRFKVLFPSSRVKTENNDIPIVSGIVPLRVELDRRDARHLTNTRFEIMLFVDGVFIYEIEEGSSPFTFNWNTKGYAKGPHIVTVNLVGYDDHIGIVSRKVIVEK